jgi:hypothetical protein
MDFAGKNNTVIIVIILSVVISVMVILIISFYTFSGKRKSREKVKSNIIFLFCSSGSPLGLGLYIEYFIWHFRASFALGC